MTKLTREQESFISGEVQKSIELSVSKIRQFYLKIVGGLGVIVLLETGALIWSLAIGTSENKYQDDSINKLSITVDEYIKSNNDLVQSLTKTTLNNAKDIEANKGRLDRSPY